MGIEGVTRTRSREARHGDARSRMREIGIYSGVLATSTKDFRALRILVVHCIEVTLEDSSGVVLRNCRWHQSIRFIALASPVDSHTGRNQA
jgi:hypothetical protein